LRRSRFIILFLVFPDPCLLLGHWFIPSEVRVSRAVGSYFGEHDSISRSVPTTHNPVSPISSFLQCLKFPTISSIVDATRRELHFLIYFLPLARPHPSFFLLFLFAPLVWSLSIFPLALLETDRLPPRSSTSVFRSFFVLYPPGRHAPTSKPFSFFLLLPLDSLSTSPAEILASKQDAPTPTSSSRLCRG